MAWVSFSRLHVLYEQTQMWGFGELGSFCGIGEMQFKVLV